MDMDENSLSLHVMRQHIEYDDDGNLMLLKWLNRIPMRTREPVLQALVDHSDELESLQGQAANYETLQRIILMIHGWVTK